MEAQRPVGSPEQGPEPRGGHPSGPEHSERRCPSGSPEQAPQAAPSTTRGSGHSRPSGANRSRQAAGGHLAPTVHRRREAAPAGQCDRDPAAAKSAPPAGGSAPLRSQWDSPLPAAGLQAPQAKHRPPLAYLPEPRRRADTGEEVAQRSRVGTALSAGRGRWGGLSGDP